MTTVGIIGFGSFGRFLAEKLSSHANVMVYSKGARPNTWSASLAQVAQCNYVILAVPLQSYPDIISQLQGKLADNTVLIDVCSVKQQPIALLKQAFATQPIVATHPMFGPESASVSMKGHTIVMCPEVSDPTAYKRVVLFAHMLGLRIVELTCEQHDKDIAVVQGLTFFVAQALVNMGVHDQLLHTPTFQRLLNLAEIERHHSPALFQTIQLGNTHTANVRKQFLQAAQLIDAELHKQSEQHYA